MTESVTGSPSQPDLCRTNAEGRAKAGRPSRLRNRLRELEERDRGQRRIPDPLVEAPGPGVTTVATSRNPSRSAFPERTGSMRRTDLFCGRRYRSRGFALIEAATGGAGTSVRWTGVEGSLSGGASDHGENALSTETLTCSLKLAVGPSAFLICCSNAARRPGAGSWSCGIAE
jgi:hypothetical protein